MPAKPKPDAPTPGKTDAPAPKETDASDAASIKGLAAKAASKPGEALSKLSKGKDEEKQSEKTDAQSILLEGSQMGAERFARATGLDRKIDQKKEEFRAFVKKHLSKSNKKESAPAEQNTEPSTPAITDRPAEEKPAEVTKQKGKARRSVKNSDQDEDQEMAEMDAASPGRASTTTDRSAPPMQPAPDTPRPGEKQEDCAKQASAGTAQIREQEGLDKSPQPSPGEGLGLGSGPTPPTPPTF